MKAGGTHTPGRLLLDDDRLILLQKTRDIQRLRNCLQTILDRRILTLSTRRVSESVGNLCSSPRSRVRNGITQREVSSGTSSECRSSNIARITKDVLKLNGNRGLTGTCQILLQRNTLISDGRLSFGNAQRDQRIGQINTSSKSRNTQRVRGSIGLGDSEIIVGIDG